MQSAYGQHDTTASWLAPWTGHACLSARRLGGGREIFAPVALQTTLRLSHMSGTRMLSQGLHTSNALKVHQLQVLNGTLLTFRAPLA